jgi:hypothetical protein
MKKRIFDLAGITWFILTAISVATVIPFLILKKGHFWWRIPKYLIDNY